MNNATGLNVTKTARSGIGAGGASWLDEDGEFADLKWPTDYLIIALIGTNWMNNEQTLC